jgi:hypothetical protein
MLYEVTMKSFSIAAAIALAFALGAMMPRLPSNTAAAATGPNPTQGWNLHIDAERHFGDAHPTEIAHHYCKPVAGGLTECQIYDSDAPDAHLVAVETIVAPATYKTFSSQEQALWHYHKDEIPKVNAKMPDLTSAEAAKTVAGMLDTYGKVWLLFDPLATNNMPIGQPVVMVLK